MTNKNPSPLTRFQLGNREGGRTKGARNRITDRFLEVFGADFDDHADTVIATVRAEDPTSYLRIVAHLLPKELEARLQVEQRAPGNLDPGEWATLRRVLDLIEAAGASGFPPEQVFQLIEHTLRAEMAKPIETSPALASVAPDSDPKWIANPVPAPPLAYCEVEKPCRISA